MIPYFDGDLNKGIDALWGLGVLPTATDPKALHQRAMTWAAMSAISEDSRVWVNTRTPSSEEALMEEEIEASKEYTARTITKTGTVRGLGNGQQKPEKPRKVNTRLSARAAEIARRIKMNPHRVLGMMESGGKNPVGSYRSLSHCKDRYWRWNDEAVAGRFPIPPQV